MFKCFQTWFFIEIIEVIGSMMILLHLSEHPIRLVFSLMGFIMRTKRGICLRVAFYIVLLLIIMKLYSGIK